VYKYLILFPLAIVEGPIIAVIAGFLCSNGYLNVFVVFPIIIMGDMIGDSICYILGRWGMPKFVKKIGKGLGIKPKNLEQVRIFFDSNPAKTISLSKIALGIGVAGIYLAGNARVPYNKFIRICLVTSCIQYVFYLTIGLLFGSAYNHINHYLNYYASACVILFLAIILFFFIKSMLRRL
jgi:membrane-associated protein